MTCSCNNTLLITGDDCGNVTPATSCESACSESSCQEDHCQKIYVAQYYSSIRVDNQWNVPTCNVGYATLVVPSLKAITIGGYIWNPTYGYFKVIGFDITKSEVQVQNTCQDGNAAVGTLVPACAEFVVCDPPMEQSTEVTDLVPYLAVDFTAPSNSSCVEITVTSIFGLAVGKDIVIGSGTYTLDSILDSTTIRICNEGEGITPGTPVYARDAAEELQYPIILIDSNICTNTAVASGAVIVCKDGTAQALDGGTVGHVLTLTNASTNEAQYQALPANPYPTAWTGYTPGTAVSGPNITSYSNWSCFYRYVEAGVMELDIRVDILITVGGLAQYNNPVYVSIPDNKVIADQGNRLHTVMSYTDEDDINNWYANGVSFDEGGSHNMRIFFPLADSPLMYNPVAMRIQGLIDVASA